MENSKIFISANLFPLKLRKGLKQSFGMDKTGPNPPTRRDHLIPPVPRAKRLPSAGTHTNQKGCLVVTRKNQAEAQHSAKQASKPAASSTKRAKRASVQKQNKARTTEQTTDPQPKDVPTAARLNPPFSGNEVSSGAAGCQ